MIGRAGRYLRTIGCLSLKQLAHRAKLRLLLRRDRHRAQPPFVEPPALTSGLESLDWSEPDALWRRRASDVAAGRFEFLCRARELGRPRLPPPVDVPLLWAYHLEYMDYLGDLARAGEWGAVEALVDDRLAAEPCRHLAGIHPYPTARRIAAWVRLLPAAPAGVRAKLARGAWGWARRLARRLEFDVGGNHLLENGLALALAGTVFRGREARAMARTGSRILVAGARDQVLCDGGHYELSPAYHARVLRVLLEGGLRLATAGLAPGGEYFATLERMAAFLRGILDPEGRLPLLGDTTREEDLDPQGFLRTVEERLPGRSAATVVGDRAFPSSGLYVLEAEGSGTRLLLDAGPTCPERLPAHGQADTFTYELHLGGVPFVVDPGLYEYSAGEMRSYCRSTRAHSTVAVDGESSSEVWSSFRIGLRARVRCEGLRRFGSGASVTAEHDGYRRIGVRHTRTASRLGPALFAIADRVAGRRAHRSVSRIHLHPDASLVRDDSGAYRVGHRGRTLFIVPFGGAHATVEPGWHCPRFGERRRSRVVALEVFGSSARFGYVLSGEMEEPPVVTTGDGFVRVSTRNGTLAGPMP